MVKDIVEQSSSLEVRDNVPAELLHSLQLKGLAEKLVEIHCESDLEQTLAMGRNRKVDFIPLGEGSNLIFPARREAWWLKLCIKGVEQIRSDARSVTLRVGAGENWHKFVVYCANNGYHGLENLALIPGSVGAAPIQNIGAYGVEAGDFISAVNGRYLRDSSGTHGAGSSFSFNHDECQFGYRDSIFKQCLRDAALITSVEFTLHRAFDPDLSYPRLKEEIKQSLPEGEITAIKLVETVVNIRRSRLPDHRLRPNAGSFFKNPIVSAEVANHLTDKFQDAPCFPVPGSDNSLYKLSAAWLIEKSELKGYRSGSLQMSEQHALVLIHWPEEEQRADDKDVINFAGFIQSTVFEKFAVKLEIEPRVFN